MSYATRQDLERRFGADEISALDRSGDGSTVEAALTDSCAEIDTMISSRYRLPLSVMPEVLTAIQCNLARMRLYDENPPDVVTEAGRNARTHLRRIRDGEQQLTAGGVVVPMVQGGARREDVDRVFTREKLEGL